MENTTYWFSFGEIKEFIYSYADIPTKMNLILRDTDYPKNLTALILLKELVSD